MISASQFVEKWSHSKLRERQGSQSFFNDLCALVGYDTPAEKDSDGATFCFDKTVTKISGRKGFVDVWHKGKFGWEFKGKHENLDAAYEQLLDYREDIGNPPLLIVDNFETIRIHTNFTNTNKRVHEIHLDELEDPEQLQVLEYVFRDPDKLKPDEIVGIEDLPPQLFLGLEQSEPVRVYSGYGLIQYGGLGPSPPLEGHARYDMYVQNTSYRPARSIIITLNAIQSPRTRRESMRSLTVEGQGWRSARHTHQTETQTFRFQGTWDQVCLGKNDRHIGDLVCRFELSTESDEFLELKRKTELNLLFHLLPQDKAKTMLEYDENPKQFSGLLSVSKLGNPSNDYFQRSLVTLYERNPAEDLVRLEYQMAAEGFQLTTGTVEQPITWIDEAHTR